MKDLRGIIPIIQTPFTDNGAVDYEDVGRVVEQVANDGGGGVALFGIASEFYKLSDGEKLQMAASAVEAGRGKIPVIVSITRNSTELALEDAKAFQKLGADALMIYSPHFVTPSTDALSRHILAVTKSIDIPLVIQYTPSMNGGLLTAETIEGICTKTKTQLYIKAEPIPAAPFIESLNKRAAGRIGLFTGNMGMHMLDLMERGVTGIMPACSMVRAYANIFNAQMSGDKEKAKRYYEAMLPFIVIINQEIEMLVRFEKKLLKLRGIIKSDYCRQPTAWTADEKMWRQLLKQREEISKIMDIGEDYA